ncbi:MAG: N-acetylmuramoyl-L-alanine amidase [Phycisphaeraceae bacterium]|nr:N-acetylmuramoyl-L-alanine amidase [Phycisphaeraceae bacterium]
MAVSNRRTVLVLALLVVSMTIASGALLVLEPRPATGVYPISLNVVDRQTDLANGLFDTTPSPDPHAWTAIVIHQSGAAGGSAETLGQTHQKLGLGGLGYHFVLGNGHGAPDGQIVAGFRWTSQQRGAFPGGSVDPLGRRTISICLIGEAKSPPTPMQLRQLVWLVQQLQAKFGISADHVLTPRTISGSNDGSAFPSAAFRQQLYTTSAP